MWCIFRSVTFSTFWEKIIDITYVWGEHWVGGGADSDTVDSDWVLRFYIFMHVFKMFFIKVKKHVFIVFFICKLIFNIYDFTQMSLISCKTRCGCDWNA